MAFRGGSTIAVACTLLQAAAQAQSTGVVPAGADPGITAVGSATPPPPTTVTVPATASPALPQTTQGGFYSPYPLAPAVAPVNAPAPPSAGPAPGSQPAGQPGPTVVVSGAAANPDTAKVIAGPPTPPGLGAPRAATTMDLVTAFQLGQKADPTYRAALAEHDVNREQATSTIAGYLPTASYTYSNVPTEGGARHVATFTQPIVSLGGIATLREKHPRRLYADATLEVRAQDLATRTLTAITDIIKANEATILNDSRIDQFKAQSDRAEKLYKGGQGTITDAEDISVRYQQALANRALLAADQIASAARLRSLTGVDVPPEAFRLPTQFGAITLQTADAYRQEQAQSNPQVEAARQTERINKLEAQRVKGSLLPVVGFSGTYTSHQGIAESYLGLSVSAPVSAGGFFQIGAANATLRKSAEETRQVEEKAKTELERLYALVGGGRDALIINAKAIEAAELAVRANSRSYEGGVRTNVDVINAIQTVYEVKNGYVQAAVTLASNYLNLLLLAGEDPEDALAQTQRFLLGH